MVEKLPVGAYTLREEQAPDGYLIAEDVKFTVKDTRKIQKVKMKDAHPYGKLVTDKTGTATSGKLPIATYKNGKVEKTVEYILVETKAPNGYELSSKKEEILFEYKDGKTKVIEIVKEIKNTKSPSGSTPDVYKRQVQRFRAFPWKNWKKIPYLIPGWFVSCPRGSVI